MAPEVKEIQLRYIILYEFQLGHNTVTAVQNICKALGENAIKLRKCQLWYKRFSSGNFCIEDLPRSGRPKMNINENIKIAVEADPSVTVRELSQRLGIPSSTVHRYLKEMGKVSTCGKWVPHKLTDANLAQRISICQSLLIRNEKEPFLNHLITGDEKWILYVNAQRKRQWLNPKQSPIPSPKPGLHPKKIMLCIWWDIKGIIYYELLEEGQTITSEKYCEQLDNLKEALMLKRPALVNRRNVIFHQDNARPHVSKKTIEKLNGFSWELLPHPPYSPDIAPSDFHLFRSMQNFLAGKIYKTKMEIKNDIDSYISSKSEKFFSSGIKKLPDRWKTIVENDGQYILD